jgi:hypothetical protein
VSTWREVWERTRLAFMVGIVATVLARGQALFGSLYSIDGYFVAKKSFNDEIAYNLGDGRFLRALLWRLQEFLGFSPIASESASVALATVALVVAAILFGEAIFGRRSGGETVLFVALLTLHPFLTEYFYYAEVAFGITLSVLLAALAVRLTTADLRFGPSILASATAVVAALATYQVAIGFIVAGFILASVMEAGTEPGPPLRRRIVIRGAALALGTGFYGLCLLVTRIMYPAVASGRAFRPGGVGFGDRLEALGQAMSHALMPTEGIVTAPVAAISGALVVCGLASIGIRIRRRRGWLASIAAVVLIGCALAAACMPSVLSRTPWLAPRLLSPSTLVFAALAVACYPGAPSWRRQAWIGCAMILLLGYVAADTAILFDQRRVNLWDHQLANRIQTRLEDQPGFTSVRRLSIVGQLAAHQFPLQTTDHDLNSTAFAAPWSKVGVIEQATGLMFDPASDADVQVARAYCAAHDPWPSPDAVTVAAQLGIVCLSKP